MKITVLTKRYDEGKPPYDPVADQIAAALRETGHTAAVFAADEGVAKLAAGLNRRKPDLVFNVLEEFGPTLYGAANAAGLLELLGYPFTGGGPGELYVRQDKALAKRLLAFEGVPYPKFAVFGLGSEMETGGNLRMPLFVKPLRMDASIGVDGKSLVRTPAELMARVAAIHKTVGDAALAEEFIDGREFYVGVIGNGQPRAFPPVEMDFSGLPEGMPRILDGKAKWDEKSVQYKGTKAKLAELPDELRARLQKVAVDAYRACRVRDYGRVDLRLAETGDLAVIEVNASCYLERSGEFATAARAARLEYPALVQRIVELALERQGG